MGEFKKIGQVMEGMAKKNKMWDEIMKIVNMKKEDQEQYHRQVLIDMQNGVYDSDRNKKSIIYDKQTYRRKVKNDKGKDEWETYTKDMVYVIRRNERGEQIIMVRGSKEVQLGRGKNKTIYDVVKDKDGYEWLKERKPKVEDINLSEIPF